MADNNNLNLPFKMPPFCENMGIEVTELGEDGRATLTMPYHEKLEQPYGILHGGSLFTIADAAAAYALAGTVERTKQFVTVEMKINFLAPVKEGIVEARARVLKGGRVIPIDVEVFNENKLVAKAIATYIILDENRKL